jgi:hypothetical protein
MTANYYTQLGVEFRQEASSRFEEYLFGKGENSEVGERVSG